ncbi:hypothetical protein LshimejAT787_1101790 [Lyophyllum shimeji]|uniref:Uncharacterized protein n=1 Tax=Lyophyllum shimeji TaxID=47721 RepID=A0A9P3PVA6_LYOSH|nr:hypothetical protein LshimejAT787_1101790 [Lyophyllum shimeji]
MFPFHPTHSRKRCSDLGLAGILLPSVIPCRTLTLLLSFFRDESMMGLEDKPSMSLHAIADVYSFQASSAASDYVAFLFMTGEHGDDPARSLPSLPHASRAGSLRTTVLIHAERKERERSDVM